MTIYSGFSHEKMVIFHSYVSLPEGMLNYQTHIAIGNVRQAAQLIAWLLYGRDP